MKKLEKLYHKGRKGELYEWSVWTEGNEVVTEYGLVDGKKQIARKEAIGKNIGKANETTPKEQAIKEAKAMHKNKLDRKYSLTKEDAQDELFLPMLAHDYEKKPKYAVFPLHVQPKYDGVRTIAYWSDGAIRLLSRSGKDYYAKHIQAALEKVLPKNSVLDGEIYQHGVGFQTVSKLIKKERPESVNLVYQIYDYPVVQGDDSLIWLDRYDALIKLFSKFKDGPLCLSPTSTAENLDQVKEYFGQYLVDGFEGAILRNHLGLYEFGYRSPNLLKYKTFEDDEFIITGYSTGVGKFDGCVIWECKTKDAKTFNVIPKGTLEEKKDWYDNAKSYIGKYLKVKYQEYTDDGVPRFPVGLGIRDVEMDK